MNPWGGDPVAGFAYDTLLAETTPCVNQVDISLLVRNALVGGMLGQRFTLNELEAKGSTSVNVAHNVEKRRQSLTHP